MKKMIEKEEYKFLKENEKLGKNIILLTLGGSHAYGTNVEGSDIDIRGCALNSKKEILLGRDFEQVIDNNTDTVVYSFNKLIGLLTDCNPNVIEMLGCKPEHYFMVSDIGRKLLDNRKMFLSQRAAVTFGGYATQQMRRLLNAIARDSVEQKEKERHMLLSCESAMLSFNERHQAIPEGSFTLEVGDSAKEEFDKEIFANINLSKYPLRDLYGMISELASVIRNYDKLNHRNRKKDEAHLGKHMLHLLRLFYTAIDIFEKEDIITYREHEREFYLRVRGGEFLNSDGTCRPEFFDIVRGLERRLEYAKANTSLPEKPNFDKINEFKMSVNEKIVRGAA